MSLGCVRKQVELREKRLWVEQRSSPGPSRGALIEFRLRAAGWDLKGGEGQALRSAEGVVFRVESC